MLVILLELKESWFDPDLALFQVLDIELEFLLEFLFSFLDLTSKGFVD